MTETSLNSESLVLVISRCPICLENFDAHDDSKTYNSRCGHNAHLNCLLSSIRTGGNYNCPECRMPFGDVPGTDDQLLDKKLKKYANMLKMNLPVAAVRQRMEADRMLPHIIDQFFTGGAFTLSILAATATTAAVDTELLREKCSDVAVTSASAKTTIKFDTYVKMLKVGMSEGAVRQKMIRGGRSYVTI